jgi:hypothetical protein
MFHISNLGHNARAAKFADINGYVPEAGDNWRDMSYDFGSDCPKRWKCKIEEAEDELSGLDTDLYCADDEDEIDALKQKIADAEITIEDLEYELTTILECLDTEWWPELLRDAIAATAEDNAELAAN